MTREDLRILHNSDDSLVIHGDCLDVLPVLGLRADAVVTDPPYGLQFMGRDWDHGVPGVPYWRAVASAMKPGAHLLAFGGTRTHHRLMTAIEDAGFEIRDVVMWVYGSGFPKGLDIGKAIDKAAGAERETVAMWHMPGRGSRSPEQRYGLTADSGAITVPTTPEAKQWDGWNTALKPAWEPIILARKPLAADHTIAQNVLTHGVGGINVDGCRIPGASPTADRRASLRKALAAGRIPKRVRMGEKAAVSKARGALVNRTDPNRTAAERASDNLGRWPANLVHDGSDDVVKCFPSRKSHETEGGVTRQSVSQSMFSVRSNYENAGQGYDDEGSAARFFACLSPLDEILHRAKAILEACYPSPASTVTDSLPPSSALVDSALGAAASEVNLGVTLSRDSQAHITSATLSDSRQLAEIGIITILCIGSRCSLEWLLTERFPTRGHVSAAGHNALTDTTTITVSHWGSDGSADPVTFDVTGMSMDRGGQGSRNRLRYCAKASKADRNDGLPDGVENRHPTVKPIALMQWLIRLITPTYGVVLDPFAGSGSTLVAARAEGMRSVGIDVDEASCRTAALRQGGVTNIEGVTESGGVVSSGINS